MDRNTIIGFSLILLILGGYYFWQQPSEAQLKRQQVVTDSLLKVEKVKADSLKAHASAAKDTSTAVAASGAGAKVDSSKFASFAASSTGTAETVVLKNKLVTLTFTNKGGSVESVVLNSFKRSSGKPLTLFDAKNHSFSYQINTPETEFNTNEVFWTVAKKTDKSVVYRLNSSKGGFIEQEYTLKDDAYTVDYNLKLNGLENALRRGSPDLKLTWAANMYVQERTKKAEERVTTINYKAPDEDPNDMGAGGDDSKDIKDKLQWIAFKQQYFSAFLISKSGLEADAKLKSKVSSSDSIVKNLSAEVFFDYNMEKEKVFNMNFFFGPNQFYTLKNAKVGIENHEMQRIIPLGWSLFGWINRFVVIPLFDFLGGFIGSMGIVILCMTLIIKFVLLPLVYKSYISSAKMKILKPELDAIKLKHNGDMQKMQGDNMALYRKAGVSPMSGCVPMLLQMPILFAMFQFFPSAFELRQKPFLWAHDLSQFDSILDFGFNIPGYGDHISLFTLLMTVSTLIYTFYNNQLTGVTGQMKWIGYLMPVIFLGVLNDYASGLTWYYFVSNVITISQQLLIRRFVDENKLHAQIAANKKKPAKKSGFQAKLEEVMKQQQQKAKTTPKKK